MFWPQLATTESSSSVRAAREALLATQWAAAKAAVAPAAAAAKGSEGSKRGLKGKKGTNDSENTSNKGTSKGGCGSNGSGSKGCTSRGSVWWPEARGPLSLAAPLINYVSKTSLGIWVPRNQQDRS